MKSLSKPYGSFLNNIKVIKTFMSQEKVYKLNFYLFLN